ncbi:MAG TPA: hypothetical protein VI136_00675 [Verrucomicrobiae bacterium]
MTIQVAVLCDAATDDRGKLNLLGAFDTICSQQMPAVHPQCAVALRVTFTTGDEGTHPLKLAFVDADGQGIMPPVEVPITVALPEDSHFGTRNFIFNLQHVKFESPGLYSVDVMLDNEVATSIPLQVRLLEPPHPPSEIPPAEMA